VVDKLRVVPNLTYWLTEPDGVPEQVEVLSTTVHPDPTNPRVLIRSVDGEDHSEREVDAKFLSETYRQEITAGKHPAERAPPA